MGTPGWGTRRPVGINNATGSSCENADPRFIFNLNVMSLRRTNELAANLNPMTGSDKLAKLALSLPLLGLIIAVPG